MANDVMWYKLGTVRIYCERKEKEGGMPANSIPSLQASFQAIKLAQSSGEVTKATVNHHDALTRTRFRSSLLSALRPGTQFVGSQRSGSTTYPVTVDLKCVDIGRSSFCGYLHIENLSPDFPVVSTFFEAEIVGKDHSFLTRKWGASEKIDRQHWTRFPAFTQYEDCFNEDGFEMDADNSDFIFMRWKEMFLIPDHKLNNIDGISFSGFYYICYQVSTGRLHGLYYHQDAAEWFQDLILQHQPMNQFPEFEFR
ncbi:hypothetical protein DSO57_1033433 [Entomophthora muscae]|uniref:Uncharacterized protein n=1 Tax=Entomophthora muscae TaxID=34485 RepID=A0ACC2U9R0_9FUNG|nr:hypothetical protein DSO57_1033433 [Entomophthora muscae]